MKGLPVVAFLLAMALLAPAAANASWQEPFFVDQGGFDANFPHVDMDDDGDALVVFNRVDGAFNRVHARPRTAAGVVGAVSLPLSVAGQHATNARVALDADGDALIVWTRSDGTDVRVQAVARSRTGVIGPVVTVSPAGGDAQDPRVAIDDDGDAIVTWYRQSGANTVVEARHRTAAGVFNTVVTMSAPGVNAYSPEVAIDDTGDGIVTWYRNDGSTDRVQYRYRPAAGPFGAIVNVSPAGLNGALPDVDMDEDGDALIAWQGQDASALQRIEARRRSAGGALGPIETVSSVTGLGAQVAMGPGGQATVVYLRGTGGGNHVESRTRSPAGAWTAVKKLSDSPGAASEPRVAAGANTAVALWQRADADGNQRIETRHWLPSAWRPFTTLSDDDLEAAQPQVAIEETGAGEAIAVWRVLDGGTFRVQASAGS